MMELNLYFEKIKLIRVGNWIGGDLSDIMRMGSGCYKVFRQMLDYSGVSGDGMEQVNLRAIQEIKLVVVNDGLDLG